MLAPTDGEFSCLAVGVAIRRTFVPTKSEIPVNLEIRYIVQESFCILLVLNGQIKVSQIPNLIFNS